ncbi:hypothetical protein [Streptomyces sp. NPDC057854]|uniref:hypothetical protein n=1 Tax=unclassified Streptomyces TaxID=2593676 RepID=UPI0036B4FCC6
MPYVPFYAGEVVTADKLATRLIEVVMDWTPLASLGAFQSGFTANPAKTPRMRIERVMGSLQWRYEGRINNTGAVNMVNTTATLFTFNSPYRPGTEHGDEVYGANSAHYPIRLGLLTTGALTGSVPINAANPTTIWLDDLCFTNPI